MTILESLLSARFKREVAAISFGFLFNKDVNNFSDEEVKEYDKFVSDNYTTINPEICKKCNYKWRISTSKHRDSDKSYWLWECVDSKIEESVTGRNKLEACLLCGGLIESDKEIILSSNTHERTCLIVGSKFFEFIESKEDVVFKPVDISPELIKVCAKTYVLKEECPYYIDHKLCELNR